MSTLKEVANKAGVSLATVSYVLNGKGNISELTKEKVLQAAEEVGYKQALKVNRVEMQKNNIMGLVVEGFRGPFFERLLATIENAATVHGYHLMAYSTGAGTSEQLMEHIFKNHRPNALIVLAHNISNDILLHYSSKDFPAVTLDRMLDGDFLWSVTVNNSKGAYEAVKYLLDNGHREIAFMGGGYTTFETQMRYKGYCDALKERAVDPGTQIYCQGEHTENGGYNTAKMLIAQNRMPGAMFCSNDEMAFGVMIACQEAGIRVPEDLSIIGFDGIGVPKFSNIILTTVKQPIEEMANVAIQTLIMAMHGNNAVKHTELSVQLVVGNSVKARS